ncbi:peptide/nickel transport system substrate-binding protein [Actinocorallia herbida]|uniref:Peptide/nickel transport system substrate-binding protein n=1 Tax=Actinocorallia herbida TaxID=58109 RepID=A0A3N1D629_9ACTN|nr:ABC transporter substrate-binding protein [Actinocorallia herbida]ROO89001.1 peptide/nickel transport system substrate-binding protein [Actinocorallia herbida]
MPASARALAALAPLLLLPACAADSSPAAEAVLQIALPADPGCLDPQQTGQLAALDVSRSLVDTLTDQDPETGEIVPWLAQEFTASADGRSFTFVLREGVTFSDGTPLDAAAVKATFDRLIKFPANGAPAYLRGYQGTKVADSRNFTVAFDAPNAQFLQATSGAGFGILSPKTAAADPAERCRGSFVGSGPFVLDHYTANQEVVLKRREGYAWPSSLAANDGAAKVAGARFVFVPEAGARTGALSSGQVAVAQNIQEADRARFQSGGFQLLTKAVPGLVPPLSLNHAGVLGDRRLREALLLGVDRQALVDTVLGAQFRPATSVLSSTTPFYADRADRLRHDPDRAKALLDEAGWKPGADGIRAKDGAPLKLVWLIPAPTPPVNELVQQQLRALGIDVELRAVPPAKYVEQQQKGEFDLTAVAVTRADPDVLRNIFSTKGANLWHLPSSELDTFLDQQASATDGKARQEAVDKAVTWILDHADTVPLYENSLVHAVSDKVKGLRLDASARLGLHDVELS